MLPVSLPATTAAPVFLFRIDDGVAAGSARSLAGLDLYSLLAEQQELLTSFGGHPLAAGLRLPAEHLPLLRLRLNQTLRTRFPSGFPTPRLTVDLTVTVAELGAIFISGAEPARTLWDGQPHASTPGAGGAV